MRKTWLKNYGVLIEEGHKDYPILFSEHMVRAILDGTKTQTRRIIKPQPDFDSAWKNLGGAERFGEVFGILSDNSELIPKIDLTQGHITLRSGNGYGYTNPNIKVKYTPGDRLWVRETWQPNPWSMGEPYFYRADGRFSIGPWKPSIFMPRAASRITLAITEVRVERLQSISEADAMAEGVKRWVHPEFVGNVQVYGNYDKDDEAPYFFNPINSFESLWTSINGASSWAANPWVWAITFKAIQP